MFEFKGGKHPCVSRQSLRASLCSLGCNSQPWRSRVLKYRMTDEYLHALLFVILKCLEKLKLVILEDMRFRLDLSAEEYRRSCTNWGWHAGSVLWKHILFLQRTWVWTPAAIFLGLTITCNYNFVVLWGPHRNKNMFLL